MTVRINVNQMCNVTLTEKGVKVFEEYYMNLGIPCPRSYKPGDVHRGEMWSIMNIFGKSFYNGSTIPFNLSIEVEE